MENEKLNFKYEFVENNEKNICFISDIEKIIIKIILDKLENVHIEYLKFHDIKLIDFNITYNVYTNKLQFVNKNNNYIKNIRYYLMDCKNINNYVENIINEINNYVENYLKYIENIIMLSFKLVNENF